MAKQNMDKRNKKKGQLTIFIILALIIVSGILIFFLWIKPTYISGGGKALNFERCIEDSMDQAIKELGRSAGYLDAEFTYMYDDEEIPYLCYTNLYYKTCTVQKPFLKQHFQDNLARKIREKVDSCYENSIDDLKAAGYEVSSGNIDFRVELEPGRANVLIEAPTTVGTQRFTRFSVGVNTPIYEMLMVATSVLQYEVTYGDSDVSSLMLFYPDLKITKMKRSDGTTIYEIEHKVRGTKFQFASKSLVWPTGYGVI